MRMYSISHIIPIVPGLFLKCFSISPEKWFTYLSGWHHREHAGLSFYLLHFCISTVWHQTLFVICKNNEQTTGPWHMRFPFPPQIHQRQSLNICSLRAGPHVKGGRKKKKKEKMKARQEGWLSEEYVLLWKNCCLLFPRALADSKGRIKGNKNENMFGLCLKLFVPHFKVCIHLHASHVNMLCEDTSDQTW